MGERSMRAAQHLEAYGMDRISPQTHTPGPWRATDYEGDETGKHGNRVFVYASDGPIADVYSPENYEDGDDDPTGERSANAILIAAAPGLYEALENAYLAMMIAQESCRAKGMSDTVAMLQINMDKAREALRKAVEG